MTLKQQISILDGAIIRLRSERTRFAATAHPQWPKVTVTVQQLAKDAMRKAGAEEVLIKGIDRVAFERSAHTLWGGSIKANNDACIEACQAGVDSIVSILDDYRKTLKEKQSNRMMWWTLIFSAIAAIGTLLSFIF